MYHYVIKNDSLSHMDHDIHMIEQIGLCHYLIRLLKEYDCLSILKESIYSFLKRRMIYTALENAFPQIYITQYYLKEIENVVGKKIVIFGAGKVGQDYYAQVSKYRKCYIVAWIDSNWMRYNFDYADVIGVENINMLLYDLIILAVRDKETAKGMRKFLINKGVDDKKIFWQEPERYF